jgi:cell division protein FtsI (penicillin-binding protein 3)
MASEKKDILWRIYLMYVFMLFFGIAILFKVGTIVFVEGEHWREQERELTFRYFNIEASRGNIFSEEGSLLATSVPIFELRMDVVSDPITDKIFYANVDSLAWHLSVQFGDRTQKEYRERLIKARKKKDRYLLIQGKVDYPTLKKVRKFPIFRMGKYKGGLLIEQKSRRELPLKNLAQRTIGYDRESKNPLGIEGAYNDYLKGISGKRLMQKIAGGVWKPVNAENEIDPQDGCDIISTIDAGIQDVAHHALEKQLIAQNAHHGCAALMEVSTGEIRAIVNLARIDTGVYRESFNYVIGESAEPGSTFKLPALMAAMEDGYADLDEIVDTENGTKKYYSYVMKDSHEGGYGKITLKEVFEKSSNVGTSKIIVKHYGKNPEKFIERLDAFGLRDPLGIELPGEANPYIKDTKSKSWSGLSLPLMSIGYEEKLAPIHTLTFYNAVANNGRMVRPRFVKEIRRRGEVIDFKEPEVLREKICSAETIRKAKEMLAAVVTNGTATSLRTAPYTIAAKTGTAQIAQDNKGYKVGNKISYQASLCGYFPADNPLYSIIVIVYGPSNRLFYGNDVAGPVFREIADKVYSMSTSFHKPIQRDTSRAILHVPKVLVGHGEDIALISKQLNIRRMNELVTDSPMVSVEHLLDAWKVSSKPMQSGTVPDVQGMGLKDALPLLENSNLVVKVKGKGRIKKQSLPAGRPCVKGTEILLELSLT